MLMSAGLEGLSRPQLSSRRVQRRPYFAYQSDRPGPHATWVTALPLASTRPSQRGIDSGAFLSRQVIAGSLSIVQLLVCASRYDLVVGWPRSERVTTANLGRVATAASLLYRSPLLVASTLACISSSSSSASLDDSRGLTILKGSC